MSSGGAEGTDGSYPGSRDREAGPPRPVVTLTSFRSLRLALGNVYTMSRPATIRGIVRSSGRKLQEKIS